MDKTALPPNPGGILSIKDINDSTWEGRLLLMSIGRLMGQGRYTNKTPEQVLRELNTIAKTVYR